MKINYILAVLCLLVLCAGCNNNNPEPPDTDSFVEVDAKKALTGTFIDFSGKEDWSQYQWDSHFQEMKELGFNTVIVQFAAYNDVVWFNSGYAFTTTKYPYALSRLLTAGVNKEIEVYIGLYFSDEYWRRQTDVDWLHLHADRCVSIAQEINQQFGNNIAFKGWYIPHEPEPYAYNSRELVDLFKNDFVNRISDKLHSFSNKPVSIAAFWNSDLTSPEQLQHFMADLSKCNLQVIMLQDGVGVGHVKMDKLAEYYVSADTGLYTENKNYTGEFWTDLETFTISGTPASVERVTTQLSVELAMSHITKAVSFQYYTNMCPAGPYGASASKLRKDYLDFIKTIHVAK